VPAFKGLDGATRFAISEILRGLNGEYCVSLSSTSNLQCDLQRADSRITGTVLNKLGHVLFQLVLELNFSSILNFSPYMFDFRD
jgi:hypothetical protein